MLVFLLLIVCTNTQTLLPNSVSDVIMYQMTPKVMFLKWEKPKSEFTLTHYDIQLSELTDIVDTEEYLCSVSGNDTQTRLPPLSTYQKYRLYIYTIFKEIASKPTVVDVELQGLGNYVPSKPNFEYTVDRSKGEIAIFWTPNSDFPGDYFYASYKRRDENEFTNTDDITTQFHVVVSELQQDEVYLFCIVAGYGNAQTKSDIKEIHT
ncbi:hypothetical protein FQR65_LT14196 [Abscondita terminalis]|nr:hypothetical protein FQR65_LT14196 [Abscondita terminalis]